MIDNNCIFCKISKGDIPSTKLYEDNDFFIIPDINPASKGHCLIVIKEHYSNILEIPEDLLVKGHKLAKKLASKLFDAFTCDGINILQNNFEAAGQSVFHYHIHVIPRYDGDFIGINWTPGDMDEKVLEILKGIKID